MNAMVAIASTAESSASRSLRCGSYRLSLARTLIMGIVNVTPDSFSDGGQFFEPDRAIAHARDLIAEGADIVDIGAESTRPGARLVPAEEELARLLPVLEGLQDVRVPISVDTSKPEVMRQALAAGASMINDVNAMQTEGAIPAVRDSGCAICLMHSKGTPQTMRSLAHYHDVVAEVQAFLSQRVAACEAAGIARERLAIDPGFGFAKRSPHTLRLLRELSTLSQGGVPIVAGISRKSTLGKITGRPDGERVSASVAAALLAAQRGAAIVRVHDVGETRDALLVMHAIQDPEYTFHD
jgi:dihydropteroate synthase